MADDQLTEGKEAFKAAAEYEDDNRDRYGQDIAFAREGKQWPEEILEQRRREGRPALTINRLQAFIRQVSNDVRQNKPSINVHPVEDGDKATADVIKGLTRNIEYTSNAAVAYHTAAECAVSGGFGYWKVDVDYAFEDTFDLDIGIERITDPLTIYGDPTSKAADSSDWMNAFETEMVARDDFKRLYKGADEIDWEIGDYATDKLDAPWRAGDSVLVANWWRREEIDRPICLLRAPDGQTLVVDETALTDDDEISALVGTGALIIANKRTVKSHSVKRITMSGAEILKEEPWMGKFIPIVPVYGDELWIDGERKLFSLIHQAKDGQRMFNYWRTASTELVALAPKVPFIGPRGAFKTDRRKWGTANRESHPFLEYDGAVPPQRQPLDSGVAAGALQEALNASDDMKSIIGLYDASLGARSNETSGRAILARQRKGDVATYHFMDNVNRAIRHTGRIILDLLPHVYNRARIVRVVGEDGTDRPVPVNREFPVRNDDGTESVRLHDLTKGKYDITVSTGPSFTTRRQEAADWMTELIRAYPQSAPIVAPHLLRSIDAPGADQIAEDFRKQRGDGLPPQLKMQIQEGVKRIAELERENQALKADRTLDARKLELDAAKLDIERTEATSGTAAALKELELKTRAYEAETRRFEAEQKRAESGAVVAEASGRSDLYSSIGEANAALTETLASLEQTMAAVAAPKQVVRDENGDIIGVEPATGD